METVEFSSPIPVRFPKEVLAAIREESRTTGITISALIRKSVMRDYFSARGDSTQRGENSTNSQEVYT